MSLFDTHVYLQLRHVLQSHTQLTADPVLWGSRQTPGALEHGTFQFRLAAGAFSGQQSDSIRATDTVAIHLTHELTPEAHDDSYLVAKRDMWYAAIAILQHYRTGANSCLTESPILQGRTLEVVGHQIRQTLTLRVSYSEPLPTE